MFGEVRTNTISGGPPCPYREFPKFLVPKSFQTSYAFDFHRHDIHQTIHFQSVSTLPSPPPPHLPRTSIESRKILLRVQTTLIGSLSDQHHV